jgi:hypothetical protein
MILRFCVGTRPGRWAGKCSDRRCRICAAFTTREQQIGVERARRATGSDQLKPLWSKRLYIERKSATGLCALMPCSRANPGGSGLTAHSLETLFSGQPGGPKSAACGMPPRRAYRPCWRRGRVAEGGGLLNRYRVVKPYRGFESLRLRHCSPREIR